MKTVAILLGDGFEEGEAINIIDILRRLQIDVRILSCKTSLYLTSYHDIEMKSDGLLDDNFHQLFDSVILVGGPDNTKMLGEDPRVVNFIRNHITHGAYVAAICSAGAKILAKNKLLGNRNYVCSSDLYIEYSDGNYICQPIVLDGQFLTGQDYGYTLDFAFALSSLLIGDRRSRCSEVNDVDWLANHINYDRFIGY